MPDPTRPLPNLIPKEDGSWTGHTVLTPTALKTRGLFTLPPSKVVPVIVVPGIMGSNLRAATSPRLEANEELSPNEAAWRPPNGPVEGLRADRLWRHRNGKTRQKLLNPRTLEVDNRGDISLPKEARDFGVVEDEVRERLHWGEVHWESYGMLLSGLYIRLNHTFDMDPLDEKRVVRPHWKDVMDCDPAHWGVRSIDKVTESELEKHANYYYPVYAFGYNWLASCDDAAKELGERIEKLTKFWNQGNRECRKVILVTHSMGGLVARACAKRNPDKILGVIHGVMPALGAPACYRRIASGTERTHPGGGALDRTVSGIIADILGDTPDRTMPVMAHSPGALQLLPNHLYPKPWLHLRTHSRVNNTDKPRDVAHLPAGNPYDLYRDTQSWYRLIDPDLADPAGKYRGEFGVRDAFRKVIESVEEFHYETLDTYYHPNTYAFYAADPDHQSFGCVRWETHDHGNGVVFTEGNLRNAAEAGYDKKTWGRYVRVEGKTTLKFEPAPQDSAGDGTVPQQSGIGPQGKVKQLFELRGFDHQSAYTNDAVLLLTQHLIVKMVQELP